MEYRFAYVDEIIDFIEGAPDPAVKMAVVWSNIDNPNFVAILKLIYDYRYNFEIREIPKYRKRAAAGIELHTAIDMLENKLNTHHITPKAKYDSLISILTMLSERDAVVLENALLEKNKLDIGLDSIHRAVPEIMGMPKLNRGPVPISDLYYPGKILVEPLGVPMYVIVNSFGVPKYLDEKGRAMISPDKIKSDLSVSFQHLKNVAFFTYFVGLTYDKKKTVSQKASVNLMEKFYLGTLEDETFEIQILDAVDLYSWISFPNNNPVKVMSFDERYHWLKETVFFSDQIKLVPVRHNVKDIEALRKLEDDIIGSSGTSHMYFADTSPFSYGFNLLNRHSF